MLFDMFNDEELTRAANILKIKGHEDNEKLLKRIRNPDKGKKGRDHVVKECKHKLHKLRGIFVHLMSALTVGWLWAIIKKTFRGLKEAGKLVLNRFFVRKGVIKMFYSFYHAVKILLKWVLGISVGHLYERAKHTKSDRTKAKKLSAVFKECLERKSRENEISVKQLMKMQTEIQCEAYRHQLKFERAEKEAGAPRHAPAQESPENMEAIIETMDTDIKELGAEVRAATAAEREAATK